MNVSHSLEQLHSGRLSGTRRLDLSANLTEFPHSIFTLADSLEILNLSGNQLTSLPDDLPRLHRLRILFCSDNHFTHLPEIIGKCPNLTMVGFKANQIRELPSRALPARLRWLILTANQIRKLPAEIGNCTDLQKLMLAGNQLDLLPEALSQCTNLELVRLAANQLTELPDWLLQMPKLAWLAFSGNPLSGTPSPQTPESISWNELTVGDRLGEGASGIILRAQWRQKPVAVKIFKGSMTSDGLPEQELAACLAAGSHPQLISLLGTLTNHPTGASGLVMDLLPDSFSTLAYPPNLDSCTRDIYPPHTKFTQVEATELVSRIAAVCSHLHSNGIIHGDLYAHNIARTPHGQCFLGDFGAASRFQTSDLLQSNALQRLDILAFGHLLGEILERTAGSLPPSLKSLQRRCLASVPKKRPLFEELALALASLAKLTPPEPSPKHAT